MRHHPRSPYDRTRLLVVYHPEDRKCVRVYAGYRALLLDTDDSLASTSLDQIVNAWLGLVEEPAHATWLREFRSRYLDLDLSAAA